MSSRRLIHETVTKISQSLENSGGSTGHNMLCYSSATSLREIYGPICKRALVEQNTAVLFLTHYETPLSISYALKEYEIPTLEHEALGSLVIADASRALSKSNVSTDFARYLETFWKTSERRGMERTKVIIDMGAFYHSGRTSELAEFEDSICKPVAESKSSTILCCYHAKDLARLPLQDQEHLPSLHSKSFVIKEQ